MDSPVPGCLLKKSRNGKDWCKDKCSDCGWNERVEKQRKLRNRYKYAGPSRFVTVCPRCGCEVDITDEIRALVAR